MKVGDVVKYAEPLSENEKDARFTILEILTGGDHPDQVVLQAVCNLTFRPICTRDASDVVLDAIALKSE